MSTVRASGGGDTLLSNKSVCQLPIDTGQYGHSGEVISVAQRLAGSAPLYRPSLQKMTHREECGASIGLNGAGKTLLTR